MAGASATVEMGVVGNTAGFVAQTTATDIDSGDFWKDATPEVEYSTRIFRTASLDLIITVATASVSAGVLEIYFPWLPLSLDGNIS